VNQLDDYIARIAALQSQGEPPFDAGLFPAWRANPHVGYRRADTTLFFTVITIFTLNKIKPHASPISQRLIEEMTAKAKVNYENFRNKDGLETYNFWKTKPSKHFPNGQLFRRFDHFRIPDDADDTAFVYLTTRLTSDQTRWLKDKLALHANGTKQRIRNTHPDYRDLRAYSTWFGKNMYVEFDACVLSNVLYWVFESKLPLNQHDTDSLAYIRSVVETGRYRTQPFRCAHQYPRTALIAYHVTRLLTAFEIPYLEPIRGQLERELPLLLQAATHPMEKLILGISLLRLGQFTEVQGIDRPWTKADFNGFYFFIAGLLTAYEQPILYRLASSPLFHIRWECEAHAWALVAEYEALRNQANRGGLH
jgi:hypothetical protein